MVDIKDNEKKKELTCLGMKDGGRSIVLFVARRKKFKVSATYFLAVLRAGLN